MERSEIQYGTTKIPYNILRSPRRKTVAITVLPAGKLILTAPDNAPVQRLDRVVHAKAQWIVTRLRLAQRLDQPHPKEFVSGETFLYLGRQYRLQVARGGEHGQVRLERGWLKVGVNSSLKGKRRASALREALVRWYRQHAHARLEERVRWWAAKVEVPEPQVLVREQRLRWGSYNANGVLRFNWRIVQAPTRLMDYVAAHEVIHLVHPNHTKAFWALLGRVMPDYEYRRHALRLFGPRMEGQWARLGVQMVRWSLQPSWIAGVPKKAKALWETLQKKFGPLIIAG